MYVCLQVSCKFCLAHCHDYRYPFLYESAGGVAPEFCIKVFSHMHIAAFNNYIFLISIVQNVNCSNIELLSCKLSFNSFIMQYLNQDIFERQCKQLIPC